MVENESADDKRSTVVVAARVVERGREKKRGVGGRRRKEEEEGAGNQPGHLMSVVGWKGFVYQSCNNSVLNIFCILVFSFIVFTFWVDANSTTAKNRDLFSKSQVQERKVTNEITSRGEILVS